MLQYKYMKAIPTLLTTNIQEFKEQLELFQKPFPRIQLDIADGKMVPNKTTQTEEIIELIASGQTKVDNTTSFDFHLMVEDYFAELEKIKKLHEMNVKIEAVLINFKLKPDLEKISAQYPYLTIGLDLNPEVSISSVASQYNLKKIKAIQIMSVVPGFQGSPFVPEVLEKIEHLRIQHYSGEIFMDGGINETTIPQILEKKYKPDFICIGSFLTKAGEKLDERIKYLHSLK